MMICCQGLCTFIQVVNVDIFQVGQLLTNRFPYGVDDSTIFEMGFAEGNSEYVGNDIYNKAVRG